MIAESAQRVESQTAPAANAAIRRKTEMRVAYYADHPEEINQRLRELDLEWDTERVMETGSSTFSLMLLALAITHNRKWILLAIVEQAFMLQHAIQGWAPPLSFLRKVGVRTANEINIERYALKALRGDFQHLPRTSESRGTAPVLEAVRR